jgi:2-iminobutanoate/2-iminopropanoate deaminase
MIERIAPSGLAGPTGPWSQGMKARSDEILFISGCVSLDADGNVVGRGDIVAQTHQTMRNFQAVVQAAGMEMSEVVKITNYLLDVRDYPAMAEVRAQYLAEPYPASTMVQVASLLYPGLLVEIEGIAVRR